MPRPKRPRYIINQPVVSSFIAEGAHPQEEVTLSLDEFEAIRLIDYDGLDQSQAAEIMQVSRQTVGRILKSGRYNLSRFVVEAQRLKVKGGCFKMHRKGHRYRGVGRQREGCGLGRRRGQGVSDEFLQNPGETRSKQNDSTEKGGSENE